MKTTTVIITFATSMLRVQAASELKDALAAIPPATDVVAALTQHDANRQIAFTGYTSMRRYTLDNKSRHASMLVRVMVGPDGAKQFTVVEESGSGTIRKHVFHKMLDEEAAASNPKLRGQSHIGPKNYSFRSAGVDTVNGRRAYVIELTPNKETKYLVAGKIWVDADEFAMLRVEGKPAKNPSFWTKSVNFVHVYDKHGSFYAPASNKSV